MQASNLRKNKKLIKPKISKIMEIKIRNQGNYRKSMKKIKTKSWFFDKSNKIGKQLVNITKKKPRQKTQPKAITCDSRTHERWSENPSDKGVSGDTTRCVCSVAI